jgi:hypothetical protein
MNKKLLISFISIVGGALLLLVVVKVVISIRVKQEKRRLDQQIADAQQVSEETATDAFNPDPEPDPSKENYPPHIYTTMAKVLDQAMRGIGTDEETIVSVFTKIRSNGDFDALNNAFGTRDGWSMRRWLKGDLSEWWIEKINTNLRRQGVTKQI